MNSVQAPVGNPPMDHPITDAGGQQLRPGHHSVLPFRELRDHQIRVR
jgi:hypothetical protein